METIFKLMHAISDVIDEEAELNGIIESAKFGFTVEAITCAMHKLLVQMAEKGGKIDIVIPRGRPKWFVECANDMASEMTVRQCQDFVELLVLFTFTDNERIRHEISTRFKHDNDDC